MAAHGEKLMCDLNENLLNQGSAAVLQLDALVQTSPYASQHRPDEHDDAFFQNVSNSLLKCVYGSHKKPNEYLHNMRQQINLLHQKTKLWTVNRCELMAAEQAVTETSSLAKLAKSVPDSVVAMISEKMNKATSAEKKAEMEAKLTEMRLHPNPHPGPQNNSNPGQGKE